MGREIRKVPSNWQHPKDTKGHYIPLFYQYDPTDTISINKYMPDWPETERTHFMMYEDTSEGTPLTPPLTTIEEVAQYLVDHKESVFGNIELNYEQWLNICKKGRESMVVTYTK